MTKIIPTEADIQYFQQKLDKMKRNGVAKSAWVKVSRQLELIKDAIIIYKI